MPDPQVWKTGSGDAVLVEPVGELDPDLAAIMADLGWEQVAGDVDGCTPGYTST